MPLPIVPSLGTIAERLPLIFTAGLENLNYVTREMAAKTIYVMFYSGAIAGTDCWVRPSMVTDMTDDQAAMLDDADREEWVRVQLSSRRKERPAGCWYAANSREPIRDETLGEGLIPTRAVVERSGIATTSSHPRYALEAEFAALFDADLVGDALRQAITAWQATHISKAAMARMALVAQGAAAAADAVVVTMPDGSRRQMAPGPSSAISKAVIEEFTRRYLANPAVLWLSESGNKVVTRDEHLAKSLGLSIDAQAALPDIILVDLGHDPGGADMLVIFCEVVATDGPINRLRKDSLLAIAKAAGFEECHLAYMTAFADRKHSAARKAVPELAWGTYAWFASEPDHITHLIGRPVRVFDLERG